MIHGVILAGGKGERFWPLSRAEHPKQLLRLISSKMMLQETIDRILPLIPNEQIMVVTSEDIVSSILNEISMLGKENILAEPFGRDTCLAIGLAAQHIEKDDADGVMVVLSADHIIQPAEKLLEIISIGALRIINCNLLYEENFDQLIDPKRSLPFESIQIHRIKPEMLHNQPTIDKVLPIFHKFSEDTILVAHNASFDMAMLKVKEEQTGVKFSNPVLDTLLLSSIVHPFQEDHNLEAIAARFGVSIVGRHTALGDAIAAGEIFLKLIPLLAKQGIYTLKEARLASRKSFYARQKF